MLSITPSLDNILGLVQTCTDIVNALHDVRDATVEMRDLRNDFDAYGRSLQAVYVVVSQQRTPLSDDVRNAIALGLGSCGNILQKAKAKINKHRRDLSNKYPNNWETHWAAVLWIALGGKKEVEAMRQRLSEHIAMIHTYLALVHSAADNNTQAMIERGGATLDQIRELLQDVANRIGNNSMHPHHECHDVDCPR
ncbi:hypothetical protein AURDEDRAFT_187721, partial [Auricularia subglabra TFB-10046 SS5]